MNFRSAIGHAVAITIAAKCASWFGINYVMGSSVCLFGTSVWAFFSASSMIKPLSGAFGGPLAAVFSCALGLSISVFVKHTICWEIFALHIPGLCAALYWTGNSILSRSINAIVPIICMALFIAHPVGSHAFVYSLWWCIPVLFSFYAHKSVLLRAVGSTAVAHAVGSVMWLYLVNPMTPSAWIALIPVSLAERLIFSCGMVCAYYVYAYLVAAVSSGVTSFYRKKGFVA